MKWLLLLFISLFMAQESSFLRTADHFYPTSPQKKKTTPAKKRKTAPTKSPAKTSAVKTSTPKTSSEAKQKQAQAQKEIKLTEAQIRENEIKVSKSLAELGKIDLQIDKTTSQIKELNASLISLNSKISSLETGIKSNETELARLREEYLKAVKKMRVTKKNKSILVFIFSSKNLNQAMRRMRYLREFADWRERQTDEINKKISFLEKQKIDLASARDEQTTALSLRKASQAKLEVQHKQQEALVAELKQNGQALQSHLKKKQAEARELGNMVSQLIAEEQRKAAEEARKKAEEEAKRKKADEEEAKHLALASEEEKKISQNQPSKENKAIKKSEAKKSEKSKSSTEKSKSPNVYADARKRAPRSKSTHQDIPEATNFTAMRGKLPVPTTGSFTVTSRFGRQHLPDLPDVEFDNPGIDAESDAGASARAVFQGTVSGVYLLPGYNTVVIVNHGNYYTVYGTIDAPAVKNGDQVEAGTTLGRLALYDDDASRSAIHFEVWKNREKLNPQDWLR